MTHLSYIIPSFALAVLLPFFLALSAATRLSAAKKNLAALDGRRRRRNDT